MTERLRSFPLGRRIRHVGRLAQITQVFARHGFWSLAERINIKSWLTPEQVRKAQELSAAKERSETKVGAAEVLNLPVRLRMAFEELGPAFVKFGQVLSTREDLMGPDFIAELSKLHSSVAPLSFVDIKQVLDKDLGDRLDMFEFIDEVPLAAGSIAQVHRGRLVTGEDVVVKVQRPGIGQQMEIDLGLMEELASLIENFVPELKVARPSAMVREFARGLKGELDFVREGGNISKIDRNFKTSNEVSVPKVFWKVSTGKVLTQSFMDGLNPLKRDEIIQAGMDPTLIVERGLAMFLKMVFVDGLFHGDLHPGNLLVLPGNRVGLLDFGLTVHLGRSTRENLAGLLVALVKEDYERVVMHYMELADPPVDFDADSFEHAVGNAVAPFIGLSLVDMRTGPMFWDLARVAAEHGAPMPQDLVIFVKTLASFEGLGLKLDPGFDVLESAQKFSSVITREIYSPDNIKQQTALIARDVSLLARSAPYQMRRLMRAALEGDLSLNIASEDAHRLSLSLDRSSARIAVALIVGALIIGSSILVFAHVGRQLYSMSVVGIVGFALAGIMAFYVIWSILRGGKL